MLCVLHLEVNVRLDYLLEVRFSVLHNDVQRVKLSWIFGVEELYEFDYEGMFEFSHEGDFTQNAFAVSFIFKDILHAFDCDLLTGAPTRC